MVSRSLLAGEKFLQHRANLRHMHGGDLPDDLQIHVSIVMRYDVTHTAHFSEGQFADGLAGCVGQMGRGLPDDFRRAGSRRLAFLCCCESRFPSCF